MTTMNISLPEEMKAFIEAQMATEGYASASEYLRTLIREAQKRQAKQALEAKFREALESGPATPMTREDWDELHRRVWERDGQEHAQQP
jgi:antitoxin ParD1/3/4